MTKKLTPTAPKPGERGFCRKCEWWGVEMERWYEDCGVWGERIIDYEDGQFCGHDDFDGVRCPQGKEPEWT